MFVIHMLDVPNFRFKMKHHSLIHNINQLPLISLFPCDVCARALFQDSIDKWGIYMRKYVI